MKSPYQRIMRASKRGVGVRLSAVEVIAMAKDHAIFALAQNDDDAEVGGNGNRDETPSEYIDRMMARCVCGHVWCEHDRSGRCIKNVFPSGSLNGKRCECELFSRPICASAMTFEATDEGR